MLAYVVLFSVHCLYTWLQLYSNFFVVSMSCLLRILLSPVISEEAIKVDKGVFSWSRSEQPALRK